MNEPKKRDDNPWAIWHWPYAIWVMLVLPGVFYFFINLMPRLKLLMEWING